MRGQRHQLGIVTESALPPEAAFEALWRHGAERLHINIPDTLTFVQQTENNNILQVRWLFTAKDGRVLAKRHAAASTSVGNRGGADSNNVAVYNHRSAKGDNMKLTEDSNQMSERELIMIEEQMVRKAFSQFAREALCSKESNPNEIAARVFYADGRTRLVNVSQLDTLLKSPSELLTRSGSLALPEMVRVVAVQQHVMDTNTRALENHYKLDDNNMTFTSISHHKVDHTPQLGHTPVEATAPGTLDKILLRAKSINRDIDQTTALIAKRINACLPPGHKVGGLVADYIIGESKAVFFIRATHLVMRYDDASGVSAVAFKPSSLSPERADTTFTHATQNVHQLIPQLTIAVHASPGVVSIHSQRKLNGQLTTGHSAMSGFHNRSANVLHTARSGTSVISRSSTSSLRLSKVDNKDDRALMTLPKLVCAATHCCGDFCDYESDSDTTIQLNDINTGEPNPAEHDDGNAFENSNVTAASRRKTPKKAERRAHQHTIGETAEQEQRKKSSSGSGSKFSIASLRDSEKQSLQAEVHKFRVEHPDFEHLPLFENDGMQRKQLQPNKSSQHKTRKTKRKGAKLVDANRTRGDASEGELSDESRRDDHQHIPLDIPRKFIFSPMRKGGEEGEGVREEVSRDWQQQQMQWRNAQRSRSKVWKEKQVARTTREQRKAKQLQIAYRSILLSRSRSSFQAMTVGMAQWLKQSRANRDPSAEPSIEVLEPHHLQVAVQGESLVVTWQWLSNISHVKIQLIRGGLCEIDEEEKVKAQTNKALAPATVSGNAIVGDRGSNRGKSRREMMPVVSVEEKLVSTLEVSADNTGRCEVTIPELHDIGSPTRNGKSGTHNYRIRISDTRRMHIYCYSRMFILVRYPSHASYFPHPAPHAQEDNVSLQQARANPAVFYQSVNVCDKCHTIYKALDIRRRESQAADKSTSANTSATATAAAHATRSAGVNQTVFNKRGKQSHQQRHIGTSIDLRVTQGRTNAALAHLSLSQQQQLDGKFNHKQPQTEAEEGQSSAENRQETLWDLAERMLEIPESDAADEATYHTRRHSQRNKKRSAAVIEYLNENDHGSDSSDSDDRHHELRMAGKEENIIQLRNPEALDAVLKDPEQRRLWLAQSEINEAYLATAGLDGEVSSNKVASGKGVTEGGKEEMKKKKSKKAREMAKRYAPTTRKFQTRKLQTRRVHSATSIAVGDASNKHDNNNSDNNNDGEEESTANHREGEWLETNGLDGKLDAAEGMVFEEESKRHSKSKHCGARTDGAKSMKKRNKKGDSGRTNNRRRKDAVKGGSPSALDVLDDREPAREGTGARAKSAELLGREVARLQTRLPSTYQILTLLALGRVKDARKLLSVVQKSGLVSLAFSKLTEEGKIALQADMSSSQYHMKLREFNSSRKGRWLYEVLDKHAAASQVFVWIFEAWLDEEARSVPVGEVSLKDAIEASTVRKEVKSALTALRALCLSCTAAQPRTLVFEAVQRLLCADKTGALEKLHEAVGLSTRTFGLWTYEVGVAHFMLGKYTADNDASTARDHLMNAKRVFEGESTCASEELAVTNRVLARVTNQTEQEQGIPNLQQQQHHHQHQQHQQQQHQQQQHQQQQQHRQHQQQLQQQHQQQLQQQHQQQQQQHGDHQLREYGNNDGADNSGRDSDGGSTGILPTLEARTSTAIRETIEWGKRTLAAAKRRLEYERLIPGIVEEHATNEDDAILLRNRALRVQRSVDAAEAVMRRLDHQVSVHSVGHHDDAYRPMSVHVLERSMMAALDEISLNTKTLQQEAQYAGNHDDDNNDGDDDDDGVGPNEMSGSVASVISRNEEVVPQQPAEYGAQQGVSALASADQHMGSDSSSESESEYDGEDDEEEEEEEEKEKEVKENDGFKENSNIPKEAPVAGLVDVDAVFAACTRRDLKCLGEYANMADMSDLVNHESNTLLHVAAAAGWLDGVHFCLARGVDINKQNLEGNTPLHLASANTQHTVELLLVALGADVAVKNVYDLAYGSGERRLTVT